MSPSHPERSLAKALVGRSFVHPLFDYVLIGGALSLVVTVAVFTIEPFKNFGLTNSSSLATIILLSTSAHFASSTIRLYTKPGSYQSLPFLTMALPLIAMSLLPLCIWKAGTLGPHLQSLYLTWSPFHYAAQAYGLSVMYSYRSGCLLAPNDKRLLWWVAMIPFFYAFISADGVGIWWITSALFPSVQDRMAPYLHDASYALMVTAFLLPIVLYVKVWRSKSGPIPLISLLILISNGIWWFALQPYNAFVWATVFHGIQYMAIVIIFHLKDQMSRPENRHGKVYHVVWFYLASLMLGYGLFIVLPRGYLLAGFGLEESGLIAVAAINIHHFIVDAYIWRLKKGDSNRQVVDSGVPAPA